MAINFPATGGQATDGSFTYTVAGIVYAWNGSSWQAAGAGASATDRSLFSVTTNSANATPALSYDNNTGVFSYTPPLPESDTLQSVVTRGNTVTSDVQFGDYSGGTANPKIVYDDSEDLLWFKTNGATNPSAKLWLGRGNSYNNLQLQTAQAETQITSQNVPLLISSIGILSNITIQSSNDIYLQNSGYDAIKVLENGVTNGAALSVELYWGSTNSVLPGGGTGGKRLETTSTGVTISGALTAGGLTYPTTNGNSGQSLVSDGAGNVTWVTSAGLAARGTVSSTSALANDGIANVSITTPKTFVLLKVETSHAAWVTLYTDTSSRTADASRQISVDPIPGSGVVAEVITTGAQTQLITPGAICFNSAAAGITYAKIVNKSGSTANVQVTLTYVALEA